MRPRIALAIAWCAAGCFSDRGLAIEVDVGDTNATSVELYLGKTGCDSSNNASGIDCATISPPNATAALAGTVWFRDDDARYVATVHDHTAAFQLRADTSTTLPIVIAVGATGTSGGTAVGTATLRDLAIPINGARVVKIVLAAASPVLPSPGTTKDLTEDRVQVWTKQTPASSCVVVEHWRAGTPTRDFVVPADDPDCDDVASECNPSAYHGSEPGGVASTPDCFTGGGVLACVLGSLGCRDDSGSVPGTCRAQQDEVCVPSQFCGCPDPGPGQTFDTTCLRARIDSGGVSKIDCNVPAQLNGTDAELCQNKDHATIRLDSFYMGGKCRQPQLGALQLADFSTSHSFGGAVMELSSPHDPCNFDITWKQGSHTSQPSDIADHGMVEVPTSAGAVLVPIVFHFSPGACDSDFTCDVQNPVDTMWTCAP